MTFSEYQKEARKTQNDKLPLWALREHSLFGLASEAGKILGYHQKVHEGFPLDENSLKLSCGDILRMVSELCDNYGWELDDIAFNSLLEERKMRASCPRVPGPNSRHYAKGEGRRRNERKWSKAKLRKEIV